MNLLGSNDLLIKMELGNIIKTTIAAGLLGAAIYNGPTIIDKTVKFSNKIVEDSVYQGQIISFGREGYFWPTWEGRLALGGDSRSVTGSFSLDEESRSGENTKELSKLLREFAENKQDVKVYGRQVAIPLPWRSSTGYHVYKVEKLE